MESWAGPYLEFLPVYYIGISFDIGRSSAYYQKENGNTQSTTNPSIYNGVLSTKYANAMIPTKFWE